MIFEYFDFMKSKIIYNMADQTVFKYFFTNHIMKNMENEDEEKNQQTYVAKNSIYKKFKENILFDEETK